MQRLILGVDPGGSGAIVAIDRTGELVAHTMMPTGKIGKSARVSPQALAGWIADLPRIVFHAYVEQVGSMPGQGLSSTFSFGHAAGVVEGVIGGLGIPITMVTPQAWKKSAGLIGKDKDASRTRALQLYPRERTLDLKGKGQALADAIFIARHGLGMKETE